MGRSISSALRTLQGLFAVYKPPGVVWKRVRDTLEMKMLKELNSLHQASSSQAMLFLPESREGCSALELTKGVTSVPSLADHDHALELNSVHQAPSSQNMLFLSENNACSSGVELAKVVTSVPSLVDHVLVKGPTFTHLKIGVGHKLDKMSSGVLVFGIGQGARLITVMEENHCTRDYTVCGTFGKATDDFTYTGKVIEKTTFDHITRDKFERVLAMIQGANHKALIMHSQVDLKSQEAYELAVQGQLRPKAKSPSLILALRCLEFSPPNFTLEIRCMHETQKYLRKVIHEIGLELRSTAVCTKVRRTRDGPFTLDCTLTRPRWDLDCVRNAIKECQPKCEEILKERMGFILKNSGSEELNRGEETAIRSS